MTASVIVGDIVLGVLTLPKLLRARQVREAVAFCAFAVLSLVLSVMVAPKPYHLQPLQRV